MQWFESRSECPACTSNRFNVIYQNNYDTGPIRDYLVDFYSFQGPEVFEYLKEASYVLCECSNCGLYFQRDIPNGPLLKLIYEQWIDAERAFNQYQEQGRLGHNPNNEKEICQVIAFLGKEPATLCFFDFGMGWGTWAKMAKDFGCDSYGTDLSLERIKFAESNGVKVIQWDEIPHHSFDFINAEQVFEHLAEPLQTLCYLKTALKSDGIIKIGVPSAKNIRQRLRIMDWKAPKGAKNSLNSVAPLEHINCFVRGSLVKMADEAGLEEVFIPEIVKYKHLVDWSGTKKIEKNILLPIYRNLVRKQKHNYIFLRHK